MERLVDEPRSRETRRGRRERHEERADTGSGEHAGDESDRECVGHRAGAHFEWLVGVVGLRPPPVRELRVVATKSAHHGGLRFVQRSGPMIGRTVDFAVDAVQDEAFAGVLDRRGDDLGHPATLGVRAVERDDEVDGSVHLRLDVRGGLVGVGRDEVHEVVECVLGVGAVDGSHRSLTGLHRPHQRCALTAADLADDDPVRPGAHRRSHRFGRGVPLRVDRRREAFLVRDHVGVLAHL